MKKIVLYHCPTPLLFLVGCLPMIAGWISPTVFEPAIIISTCFLAWWSYAVARELNRRTSSIARLPLRKFTRRLIYVCVLIALLSIDARWSEPDNKTVRGWEVVIGVAVQFPLFYWIFYCLNFFSRSIAQAETQKAEKFDRYAGYFVSLFFFPFGIWWVNPRIISLLASESFDH